MSAETLTIHAIITGRVQGVWFRAWTQDQANKLGVDGWVRNRTDGTVEAVMSGPRHKVEALLALCRKGPMLARVDGVRSEMWEELPSPGFAKLPTA